MTFWIVSWMALSCPGGVLKGLIPTALRPIVCDSTPTSKTYESEQEMLAKLRELGPKATAQACLKSQIAICNTVHISWEPVIEESK